MGSLYNRLKGRALQINHSFYDQPEECTEYACVAIQNDYLNIYIVVEEAHFQCYLYDPDIIDVLRNTVVDPTKVLEFIESFLLKHLCAD